MSTVSTQFNCRDAVATILIAQLLRSFRNNSRSSIVSPAPTQFKNEHSVFGIPRTLCAHFSAANSIIATVWQEFVFRILLAHLRQLIRNPYGLDSLLLYCSASKSAYLLYSPPTPKVSSSHYGILICKS